MRLILQNKGNLSKSKQGSLAEIIDQEVERVETAVWDLWQESHQSQIADIQ